MQSRRGFLKGLAAGAAVIAAPALAREGILMPVKPVIQNVWGDELSRGIDQDSILELMKSAHAMLQEQCSLNAKQKLALRSVGSGGPANSGNWEYPDEGRLYFGTDPEPLKSFRINNESQEYATIMKHEAAHVLGMSERLEGKPFSGTLWTGAREISEQELERIMKKPSRYPTGD